MFDQATLIGHPDGQILERFAAHRDGTAFEALVHRHGPSVLGVCWRFLRNSNDAADAFEATFVILARRAGSLRDREALGLSRYGVAYRVARRARSDAERRRQRESPDERSIALAAAPEAPGADLGWLIDEEILRLPAKLRLPVIHCQIEGLTYDEAARQLRWTTGMVCGRLAEARAPLRERLVRRGVSPALAFGLGEGLVASAPSRLIRAASRVILDWVAGRAGPSAIRALADRTWEGWLMGKVGQVAVALVVVGCVLGVGSASFRLLAREPRGALSARDQAPKEAPQALPRPKPPEPPAPRSPASRRRSAEGSISPITIEGRALDPDERPVAGAVIFVTDQNRPRPFNAEDILGRFVLRNVDLPVLLLEPGPIPRPTEGRFEVAGSTPGWGFTYLARRAVLPARSASRRPDKGGAGNCLPRRPTDHGEPPVRPIGSDLRADHRRSGTTRRGGESRHRLIAQVGRWALFLVLAQDSGGVRGGKPRVPAPLGSPQVPGRGQQYEPLSRRHQPH